MIEINKPKFDKRNYYGSELSNGIKYIIINDSHLEKSYVTVSLNVGSYSNPKNYDGLAHFLEHMLFMGSKKYPDENHYNTRLNELGGSSNAYTDLMETVYYFNVYDNGLNEIMDIFSRFFIDPLFDNDSVNREINAVDSEHKKNIHKDFWKKFQLMLYLTDPDSPTNQFITGSLNTLNKPDIREKVIEFYKNNYIPENISICVASSKDIKQIEKMISDTFGNIKPSSKHKKLEIAKPFYSKNKSKCYHLKSLSNIYELSYIWEVPTQDLYKESKDFTILELLLSNKSANSMYFYLKNHGYINGIKTETKYEGIFIVSFIMTKEGFDNMDIIQKVFYECLNQIKESDVKKYADYYQRLMSVNFECIEKFQTEDLCNLLAVNHHYEETSKVFESTFKISKIKSTEEYLALYNKYIKQDNAIKIISSSKYPNEEAYNYEKIREYEATYAIIPNIKSSNLLINESFCCFDINNQYLNANPTIINGLDKYDIPALIGEKQWYGGCSKFSEPLLNIWFQFSNSKYFNNSKNYVLTSISCSILNFLSSVILFKPLELCYSITFAPRPSTSAIVVSIKGLNDSSKLELLMKDISDFILDIDKHFLKLSKKYVDNLLISFSDAYSNIKFLNSWEYLSYLLRTQTVNTEYMNDDLDKQLKKIDYDTIKNYLVDIIKNSSLTSLVYGNIEPSNATIMLQSFNKFNFNNSFPLPNINELENFDLNHPNTKEKSNCVCYFYPIGSFVPREFVLMNLAINILGQSFFDDLRTKNQLGYLVSMNYLNIRDQHYIIQKIQSEKPIEFIEDKMKSFNSTIKKQLMDADFKKFIATLENQLSEPDYSLEEKVSRYLPEISLRQYLFNRNELLLDQLKKISRDDLVEFVENFIKLENRKRFIIKGN